MPSLKPDRCHRAQLSGSPVQYRYSEGRSVSRPKFSGFAEVGHHILPTFPLETVCARKRSVPLAQQALGAPPIFGSFNVRRKRGGVVCHALDRGTVGSLGLGFETDAEPVGFEYGG